MPELLLFTDPAALDEREFLDIFLESSLKNAPRWYPELSPEDALKKYESGFMDYIRNAFFAEGGILAVLTDAGHYRSSLRLHPQGEAEYMPEALETRPDSRGKGYGKELMIQTIKALEEKFGAITLNSFTWKTNYASLATHRAAGFARIHEYYIEDGVKDENCVTLLYKTKR